MKQEEIDKIISERMIHELTNTSLSNYSMNELQNYLQYFFLLQSCNHKNPDGQFNIDSKRRCQICGKLILNFNKYPLSI